MLPDKIEKYENGAAGLEIHEIEGEHKYWIKGGVGTLWFDEQGIRDLTILLNALRSEFEYSPRRPWLRIFSFVFLLVIVVAIIVAVT